MEFSGWSSAFRLCGKFEAAPTTRTSLFMKNTSNQCRPHSPSAEPASAAADRLRCFLLLTALYLIATDCCSAQTTILPGPMRAAEAYPLPNSNVATVQSNGFITPLPGAAPQSTDNGTRSLALAPYGYPSGYPDSISESADSTKALTPRAGIRTAP